MDEKTKKALTWLATLLHEHDIPYQIGGGTATFLYGSERANNDIDVSMSGKDFDMLVPLVSEYIVSGPKHYQNEKWDCTTLSLNYEGQDIDLTDADTLLMRDREDTKWIENKLIYQMHESIAKEVDDVSVLLTHPRVLLEYKKELSGEHQEYDITFLERYIEEHNL